VQQQKRFAVINTLKKKQKGEGLTMETVFDGLYERTVRAYLDVLIMQELKVNPMQGTKELMSVINSKYGSNISWGLLLAALISMQKSELINESCVNQTVYELSVNGEQRLASLANFTLKLKDFLKNVAQTTKNI
jgi:hypothetical protein